MIRSYFARLPLVAILRGVTPDEVVAIGRALVAEGFMLIEVPLNSPQPIESIRRLADVLGPDILVGAGTVISPIESFSTRVRFSVMPNALRRRRRGENGFS